MKHFTRPNRRCRKMRFKIMRRFCSDTWGRLAIKRRRNRITKLISSYAKSNITREMRLQHMTKTARKALWKNLYHTTNNRKKKAKKKNLFIPKMPYLFEINDRPPLKRPRRSSYRGLVLKQRKQIALFITAGKVRAKTWRRYSEMASGFIENVKNKKIKKLTYGGIVESRIDVLLVRANFVDSIFKARQMILNRKAIVGLNRQRVINPGFTLKIYQPFSLIVGFMKKLRKNLYLRIKKNRIINFPSYLYINFRLLYAFKICDPMASLTKYPFGGSLATFRQSYRQT